MGVIVAFVSQKGGVGKSTLAREAAAGGLSVKVADLDVQQGTLVNWQRRRLAAGCEPSVSVESFRMSWFVGVNSKAPRTCEALPGELSPCTVIAVPGCTVLGFYPAIIVR